MEVEGYVIKIKESSDYANLKSIIRPIDNYPVITQEMLALMEDMIKRYHLRRVDVLRLFIPAQMRGGRVKELTEKLAKIKDEYRNLDNGEFIKKSATAQNELVEYLKTTEWESVSKLNAEFSASALRNLIARGIVEVTEIEQLRSPYSGVLAQGKTVTLTAEQQKVVDAIGQNLNKTYLLFGVTGSGKTEVYMNCISRVIEQDKTAIMLVPEISLTPQVLRQFRSRFGESVAILHSGLSVGERFDEWRRLRTGKAKVAIGARSAVFAPLQKVGLVIIDEEHDNSYISESNPRYVTHQVAEFRARYNRCPLILGSATPSIDSYTLAKSGEYELLRLKHRVNERAMPSIEVVDMRKEVYDGNNDVFSRSLLNELTNCMARNEQAMIFINRRGYSSYLMCRSCGYVAKCDQCDVSLVYHKEEHLLKCHYCGNRYKVPTVCPNCGEPSLKRGFVGTEQIVEKLSAIFPDKKILRMDNDTTQNKDAHAKILGEFSQKKAHILVGTQMIAKGHDFPDVTLVGIIDADMSLHFADYRSNERTYQLITQVSGRAGRDKKEGRVVLQTYSPHHYVYRFALKNDYEGFYEKESNLREVTKYPPYSKIVRILASGEDETFVTSLLKSIFDEVGEIKERNEQSFAYYSAMKSPVKRIQNRYRMQIMMRIVSNFDEIIQQIYSVIDKYLTPKASIFVEINPANLS
ncbi:MAG: primosomal protein N' [Clostridia bacterium]|nr:primosomal protein N' [Clostridia bacterium]